MARKHYTVVGEALCLSRATRGTFAPRAIACAVFLSAGAVAWFIATLAGAPLAGKFWDGPDSTAFAPVPLLRLTDAPPNPQIAVGPDDILTVVDRTIARYPNPNGFGNSLVPDPQNNPPTAEAHLPDWTGRNLGALCPSGTASNSACVVDNVSIRYDQMQGRFVVLFTATDIPARRSNFVLVLSNSSHVCENPEAVCHPFRTPNLPGTSSGEAPGWIMYSIPVNIQVPNATATILNDGNTIPSLSVPSCPGGGGPGAGNCTNYFPTEARIGLDNDNIILTAPVLDDKYAAGVPGAPLEEGQLPYAPGQRIGFFAGTRVVTVPKLMVYNDAPNDVLVAREPGLACIQLDTCGAISLADNASTGTLTGSPTATVGSVPSIFWEPDNLRGRALASFDAQVQDGGVITPIDVLVGRQITDYPANPFPSSGSSTIFLQPIVFTCPKSTAATRPGRFCGAGRKVLPHVPHLGSRKTVLGSAVLEDSAPVGQTNANDGTSMANKQLFVADSRPQQAILREGILYTTFTGQAVGGSLPQSNVFYDIFGHLAVPPATCGSPVALSCAAFSLDGVGSVSLFLGRNFSAIQNIAPNTAGYGFYAPMFDVPVDVVRASPTLPINLFPWQEKLFVGMTTGGTSAMGSSFATKHPSLWDFRPGDDAYDTVRPYLDPFSGIVFAGIRCGGVTSATCPTFPFGTRGGASTDPNDGSLWLFGQFAKTRLSTTPGPGRWGTSVANYALDFPASDSFGNAVNTYFSDVQPGFPSFPYIQAAKNTGVGFPDVITTAFGTCPPTPGSTGTTTGPPVTCSYFDPDKPVTRSEMARWIVLSQMDEPQVNAYLMATGGIPGCTDKTPAQGGYTGSCVNQSGTSSASSFSDPAASAPCDPRKNDCNYFGILNDPNLRYIEVLHRRGITAGCGDTDDHKFCGGRYVTHAEMAVFIIRAKMNNVFPTTLSGSDSDFGLYIQKMRELRISTPSSTNPFTQSDPVTRKEVATFIVRAFFL